MGVMDELWCPFASYVALPQGDRGILFLIIPEGGNKHPKGDGAHPEGGEAPRGMGAVSRGVFIAS